MSGMNVAPTVSVYQHERQANASTVSITLTIALDGNMGNSNQQSISINPTVVYPNRAITDYQNNASVVSFTSIPLDPNGSSHPRPDMSVVSVTPHRADNQGGSYHHLHPGMSAVSMTPTYTGYQNESAVALNPAVGPGASMLSVTPTVAADPNETITNEKQQRSQQPAIADVEKQPAAPAPGAMTFPEGSLRGWLTVLGAWLVRTLITMLLDSSLT